MHIIYVIMHTHTHINIHRQRETPSKARGPFAILKKPRNIARQNKRRSMERKKDTYVYFDRVVCLNTYVGFDKNEYSDPEMIYKIKN